MSEMIKMLGLKTEVKVVSRKAEMGLDRTGVRLSPPCRA